MGHTPREVPEPNVQRNRGAALVLASNIVGKPGVFSCQYSRRPHEHGSAAHQVITPGNAAYDPATQKNVPKYLTPKPAFEIWMPKPRMHIAWPARINGKRYFVRSDSSAKPTVTNAARGKSGATLVDTRVYVLAKM